MVKALFYFNEHITYATEKSVSDRCELILRM